MTSSFEKFLSMKILNLPFSTNVSKRNRIARSDFLRSRWLWRFVRYSAILSTDFVNVKSDYLRCSSSVQIAFDVVVTGFKHFGIRFSLHLHDGIDYSKILESRAKVDTEYTSAGVPFNVRGIVQYVKFVL